MSGFTFCPIGDRTKLWNSLLGLGDDVKVAMLGVATSKFRHLVAQIMNGNPFVDGFVTQLGNTCARAQSANNHRTNKTKKN